jgi:hypothetical protein
MPDPIDQEIEAIRAVLAALNTLSEKARVSVLDYVTKRLGMETSGRLEHQNDTAIIPRQKEKELFVGGEAPIHIKTLKEEKKPRSANEMAALVGYYLASLAPLDKRKMTVNQKDIETYFKIAGFPLPNQIRVTLTNAKTAGYFDAAGNGEYKLNAVGHNLVVHSMPRGSSTAPTTTKRASKRQKR